MLFLLYFGCEMIILRNKSHGEIIRICMGILRIWQYLLIPRSGRKYSHTNSYYFAMTPISQDDYLTAGAWAARVLTSVMEQKRFNYESWLFVKHSLKFCEKIKSLSINYKGWKVMDDISEVPLWLKFLFQ